MILQTHELQAIENLFCYMVAVYNNNPRKYKYIQEITQNNKKIENKQLKLDIQIISRLLTKNIEKGGV